MKGATQLPFLLFILIFSSEAFGQQYLDKQWLNLLRYRKTMLGFESEVDSQTYFISPEGKYNPQKEWDDTIAFLKDKKQRCMYPGRYLYFHKKGILKEKESFNHCSDYKKFLRKIDIDSVSVIFSSYYLDKPASAFGHTLFKINNRERKGSDLSDYGVDFSAKVTTGNPFLYGLFGITGGFYGNFNLMPYFLKLREYNDYDSRDLWEFKLNLSAEEKELFVAHLWDMNRAKFNYYYFSENCSYHVLGFLDAIVPRYNLMSTLGSFVAPIDTLAPLLAAKGLLSDIYLRPSLLTRVKSRISRLSDSQRLIVKAALEGGDINEPLKDLSTEQKAKTLDAAIDLIDYKHSDQIFLKSGNGSQKINNLKRKVLIARSQVEYTSSAKNKISRPDLWLSHKSGKFGLGFEGSDEDRNDRVILNNRWALHDYREPAGDLYGNFSLQMGRIEGAYLSKDKKLRLRRFEIANVFAMRPINFVNKKISWNFSVGAKNDDVLKRELGGNLDLGVGAAFQSGVFNLAFFLQNNVLKEIKGKKDLYVDFGPRALLGMRIHKKLYGEFDYFYSKNVLSGNDFRGISRFSLDYYSGRFGGRFVLGHYGSELRSGAYLSLFY